jgi:hypothetical protein
MIRGVLGATLIRFEPKRRLRVPAARSDDKIAQEIARVRLEPAPE